MPNPFAKKLSSVTELPEEDVALLDGLVEKRCGARAKTDLVCEGEAPQHVHMLLRGIASRCKYQNDGKRQIVSYVVPGDLCDAHVRILGRMDHTITTLTECDIVRLSAAQMDEIMRRPALAKAMWWSSLVEESILREWVVNVATRPAQPRLAHLFCELYVRLRNVGEARAHTIHLPLTQQEIGETVGLSNVHVNRALQALRAKGLIQLQGKELKLTDPAALVKLAGFNAAYLHLGQGSQVHPSPAGQLEAGAGPHSRQ